MTADRPSLCGKVVIVTGASSGIGQGIAEAFAKVGAKIVISGRNAERLEKTKKLCETGKCMSRTKVLTVVGDITNDGFRSSIIEKTVKTFGRIDILVNNAGIFLSSGSTLSCSNSLLMSDYNTLFDTNVVSVVDLTKKCLDHLIASKGNVINVSSIAGTKTFSGANQFYSMTKAAINMFTKGLANELGSKGVRVNCICPGPVETSLMEQSVVQFSKNAHISEEQARQVFEGMTVMNKAGRPKDIANYALFLGSDDASFITGAICVIDGGALVK